MTNYIITIIKSLEFAVRDDGGAGLEGACGAPQVRTVLFQHANQRDKRRVPLLPAHNCYRHGISLKIWCIFIIRVVHQEVAITTRTITPKQAGKKMKERGKTHIKKTCDLINSTFFCYDIPSA